jgi:hypothetical protein
MAASPSTMADFPMLTKEVALYSPTCPSFPFQQTEKSEAVVD